MAIFEAGIITKMTENEYENLGKQQKIQVQEVPEGDNPASNPETKRSIKSSEDDKLKPINLKMLQGVFYLLFIGNIFAGKCAHYKLHNYIKMPFRSNFTKWDISEQTS